MDELAGHGATVHDQGYAADVFCGCSDEIHGVLNPKKYALDINTKEKFDIIGRELVHGLEVRDSGIVDQSMAVSVLLDELCDNHFANGLPPSRQASPTEHPKGA